MHIFVGFHFIWEDARYVILSGYDWEDCLLNVARYFAFDSSFLSQICSFCF